MIDSRSRRGGAALCFEVLLPTAVLAAATVAIAATGMAAQAAAPPGYKLVWSEEFNQAPGSGPNPASWNMETGKSHVNNESETYVDDREHARIVNDAQATDGRALEIVATNANGDYRSTRMNSSHKRTFQFGYIEARIRLPYGQGIWPAFWMLGSNIDQVGWPACGENDIMENIGMRSWWGQNQSSLHSARAGGHGTFDTGDQYHLPDSRLFKDDYHLFQCLWQRDSISFFIDGHLYGTRTAAEYHDNPWPFNAPMFFIVNVAVGGGWPGYPDATTIFPQQMRVDYIRVYQQTVRRAPATPAAPTAVAGDAGRIAISWPTRADATTYTLYRSTHSGDKSAAPLRTGIANGVFVDTGVTAGKHYYYTVAAVNPAGHSRPSREASAVGPPTEERPYGNRPLPIPGRISFVDFDRGGEGVGYHDSDPENHGGAYRPLDGVDIESTADAGNGYAVGYTAADEWMRYAVDVASAGRYRIAFRIASANSGGTFHLEDEAGASLTGPVSVPGTGDWQKWTTVSASATLRAGHHVLKFVEDTGGYNLNWMEFTKE